MSASIPIQVGGSNKMEEDRRREEGIVEEEGVEEEESGGQQAAAPRSFGGRRVDSSGMVPSPTTLTGVLGAGPEAMCTSVVTGSNPRGGVIGAAGRC